MENRKVMIENMTNSRVGIDIPELRLMRVWEKKGVKKPVDFDILKEAIYNEGVEYMFKTGILYIDDIDVKIELGLEESKEDLKIKVLKDDDCERLWNQASFKNFKNEINDYSREQLQVLADYAIAHKILNLDKSEALKKKINIDVVRTIQNEASIKED